MIVDSFTPGPWEVGGPYPSVTVIAMVDPGCGWPEPEPPQYEPICYVHDGAPGHDKPPPPVALANARLIAAAPDLLAACQSLIGRFFVGGILSDELIRDETDAIRAAIAKATGEKSC
jgi:hypothetical protein